MTNFEAAVKSLIWRFSIAIPLGMAVAYYYTDSVSMAFDITIVANILSTILYYLFDIFWFNKATKYFKSKKVKIKASDTTRDIIKRWKKNGHKIYMTSGGFDPLHIGHLKCIQETVMMAEENNGKVIVLVNGDQFLINKKGKPFMKSEERCAIISAIKGVDLVIDWYDGSQTVTKAIRLFKPNFFTKGGDRSDPKVIPEWDTCEKIGCEVILNVGGGKIQSSSLLLKNIDSFVGN